MISQPPLLFALLDAARMGAAMTQAKERFPNQYLSLYKGQSETVLAEFAPYLFWFDTTIDSPEDWFMTAGWGQSWGIFVQTNASVETVYQHFRRFLIVRDEQGREMYFRFYDPRVLRTFLPTCDAVQLADFFGPVQQFALEDAASDRGICFWLAQGQLQHQTIAKESVLQNR